MSVVYSSGNVELTLNLVWLSIAAIGLLLARRRSRRVWLTMACAAALLFPIISASDDLNADRTLNDAAAAIVVVVVLAIAFIALDQMRAVRLVPYVVHVATPSDPRSPPAR